MTTADIAALQAENQRLRAQVAMLEQERDHLTDRYRHEEALRLTQFALDRAADMVLWHDQAGRVVYANEAACRTLGYTRDELLNMHVPELDANFTLEAAKNLWKALEEQDFLTLETRHQRKDGSTFPVEVIINAMRYNDRDYMCIFARDITERKAFESEQRRFKALADNAVDGIAISNAEANLVYTNQAFQQMLGHSETELYDFSIIELYPPEIHAFIAETIVPAIFEQGAWQGMLEMQHRNGTRLLVQHSAFALYDETGRLINMANILRDVTAEQQDAQTLQRYAAIIESTTDGIASANEQARILMMNPAFRRLVNIEADSEITDYYIADFHPAWALEKVTSVGIPSAIRDGAWADETALLNPETGAEFPVSQVIISHKKSDGSLDFISTIIRDLTQQKQAERAQAELQQQIIEAQRHALRELSTPLIPISDEVVIMPLIGTIDSGRAQQVMETLLEGVAAHQSNLVILDITGVAVVDTQVAQAFIQAAQAVRLLGAQVMITGIQPHIAQTLVSLGIDLSGIRTRSTLQSGIASALQH
jgi:rsbT co-antagonist protein RsbR